MNLPYGFVKCKAVSGPRLQSSTKHNQHTETQYHVHLNLAVPSAQGNQTWDTAINVGTTDADDLLRYKIIFDLSHPVLAALRKTPAGYSDLTGASQLPALDFLRSDILAGTGDWRDSDPMDGTTQPEPIASLNRLLARAFEQNADLYLFGHPYNTGLGIHDIHMNQGSTGKYLNPRGTNASPEHNDVWQDGAVLVDFGQDQWAAFFSVFTKQLVPTDNFGDPRDDSHGGSHGMGDADDGSLKQ